MAALPGQAKATGSAAGEAHSGYGGAGRGGGRRAVAAVEGSGDGSGGGGRGTAGACVARAVSGFPGGGFEFLLGPFCVPPKLTLCFQFFSLFLLPFGFVFVIM